MSFKMISDFRNMEKVEQYVKFFDLQRREQEREYVEYANTSMCSLFLSGRAYYGEIVGIDKSSKVVMRFCSPNCPRLKIPMTFCVLRDDYIHELGLDFNEWRINSLRFREQMRCHSSFSDVTPVYRMRDDKMVLGCDRIDIAMFHAIEEALHNKRKLLFVMLETLPPTELLKNLKEYIELNPKDRNLLLEPKRTYDEWKPVEIASTANVDDRIVETLMQEGVAVLQGPPGTGKSYTIAGVISKVVSEGNTVCVTTQSNASLLSLLSQEPIKEYYASGKIRKTNLTSDEHEVYPEVKSVNKDLVISEGELLCSTYYSLSRVINKSSAALYDLIIIEEASQAYLTAIAAFRRLGKMCLIVGDPMQLPPVVKINSPTDYDGIDVETQINGMMTTICATDIKSYRITTSYRLTAKSAKQSSVFYNGNLSSVRNDFVDLSTVTKHPKFFPHDGGTIVCNIKGTSNAILSKQAINVMRYIEFEFKEHFPEKRLAILTPFIETAKRLQAEFCGDDQTLDITVETIHRIQGLTVDYAIYYVPMRNADFAFSDNLFNVATSRSLTTTLLLTDLPLELMPIKSAKVKSFISQCDVIESE